MKFVNKLNLEKYFDGIFPKMSSKNPKLKEITSRLCVRMEEESITKGGCTYAPNNYTVYINIKDYRKLKTAAQSNLDGYFETYLAKEARSRGYIFTGDLSVNCLSEKIPETPGIKIIAGFTHEKTGAAKTIYGADEKNAQEETRIFEKVDITLPIPVKSLAAAAITVVTGLDVGVKIEFADARINIGRRPSNEMVLNDKSASRLHAYIVREKSGHVLYDAYSLNGTYVNGEHVTRKNLADGDEIKIGDTVILYKLG